MPHPTVSRYTADQALQRLKDGNARFVHGTAYFPTVHKDVLAELAKEQHPYATILGCSDSRVPPELVFDAGFGELFIIRVAGNVISAEIMGTLQYAGLHLQTPLFVVLGHSGCGAIKAALAARAEREVHPMRIARLLDAITPGLVKLDDSLPPADLVAAAVEANVRWSMKQILETPEAKTQQRQGRVRLVGGVYDLATGQVRFLD
jgi:carbonic anhydrase